MEALSCMLNKACEVGILSGFQVPNAGPLISHLPYADDAMIIGEWSLDNFKTVVRIMRCFRLCLGLKINLLKSNLFGSGKVEKAKVVNKARVLGCNQGTIPFNYLAIVVGANMTNINNWHREAHYLSIGGRVTLKKSVLESLPNYWRHWKSGLSLRKWRSWALGLARLKTVNYSLLTKWVWRYKTEKEALWRKIIEGFHRQRSGWESVPVIKSITGTWKNIACVVNKLSLAGLKVHNFVGGELGDGKAICFCSDIWLEKNKSCKAKERFWSYGNPGNGIGHICRHPRLRENNKKIVTVSGSGLENWH
ncbi:uncharacterized protein LOC143539303 [Bidens hawaiensis]|uniref:uncharacterized protein LOC143539303 n=1 Tax=Bidens hawaiensis TaxID=980011 RepID=UPI004048ECEE